MNDIETYPEIKQYLLINLYNGSENRCTENQLIDAFGYDNYIKILNNKHPAWQIIML